MRAKNAFSLIAFPLAYHVPVRPSGPWCWLMDPDYMVAFNSVWILIAIVSSTAMYLHIICRLYRLNRRLFGNTSASEWYVSRLSAYPRLIPPRYFEVFVHAVSMRRLRPAGNIAIFADSSIPSLLSSKSETETMQENQMSRVEVAKRDVDTNNVEVMLETNLGTSGYPPGAHLVEGPKKDYDSAHVALPSLAVAVSCEHNEAVDLDSAADIRRVRIVDKCVAVVTYVPMLTNLSTSVRFSRLRPLIEL